MTTRFARRSGAVLRSSSLVLVLAAAAPFLLGQTAGATAPTIISITPGYGGAGPNAVTPLTITGANFDFVPGRKTTTRFVDIDNVDVFTAVSCTSTSSCTAYPRPGRVPAGSVSTLQVFAMAFGVRSAGSVGFKYYGDLVITSVVPNTGPASGGTGVTINGGPFTSSAGGYPGTTSIYLSGSINDYASGCAGTSQCSFTTVLLDTGVPQGAFGIDIRTPGGWANPTFIFGAAPATPAVTSVTPNHGPAMGGTTVSIIGANFLTGTNRTVFTFTSVVEAGGMSATATNVNCDATTHCTATTPSGWSGAANVQVQTVCPAGQSCMNPVQPRAAQSVTTSLKSAFVYAGIKTDPGSLTTLYTSESGQSAQFKVSLASQPAANVHVALTLSSNAPAFISVPGGLDFTPSTWQTPQTVTVTGTHNAATSVNEGYSVNSVATSTDPEYNNTSASQSFVNVDMESKNIYISPQTRLLTTRAGGTATFVVALTRLPTAPVTITLTSNDPQQGTVSPTSLVFLTTSGGATGWDVPRTVTITGHNDGLSNVDRPYSIMTTLATADATYGGMWPPDVQVTNRGPRVTLGASGDFDGDGKADVAVFRASTSAWYIRYSSTSQAVGRTWGTAGDIPVSGDYDGDGKDDVAVFRPSDGGWYIQKSSGGVIGVAWGANGDIPVPADYDGDGKTDIAVFRPSQSAWYIMKSSGGASGATWGATGDIPVPADYDGDGKADVAVFRPSDGGWYIVKSSGGGSAVNWGAPGDTPVVGDYDGDGKADIGVFRAADSGWYIVKSSGGSLGFTWGATGDIAVFGDFDGDHKADPAVFRESDGGWYVAKSSGGSMGLAWGTAGDLPI